MFVLSAGSGELKGGSLTLRDVGRRVTWATHGAHSGVVSAERLHRRLFRPGIPRATGTLRVTGRPDGRDLTIRLNRARYDASRRWVKYGVKRLTKRAGHRRFGSATLSLVHTASEVGSSSWGGKICSTQAVNHTIYGLQALDSRKWDTDTWNPDITPGIYEVAFWESDGGFLRGCSNSALFQLAPDPRLPVPPPTATFEFTASWFWGDDPSYRCESSNPQFSCEQVPFTNGAAWAIRDKGP
jgi:hypothetical protein